MDLPEAKRTRAFFLQHPRHDSSFDYGQTYTALWIILGICDVIFLRNRRHKVSIK